MRDTVRSTFASPAGADQAAAEVGNAVEVKNIVIHAKPALDWVYRHGAVISANPVRMQSWHSHLYGIEATLAT